MQETNEPAATSLRNTKCEKGVQNLESGFSLRSAPHPLPTGRYMRYAIAQPESGAACCLNRQSCPSQLALASQPVLVGVCGSVFLTTHPLRL